MIHNSQIIPNSHPKIIYSPRKEKPTKFKTNPSYQNLKFTQKPLKFEVLDDSEKRVVVENTRETMGLMRALKAGA